MYVCMYVCIFFPRVAYALGHFGQLVRAFGRSGLSARLQVCSVGLVQVATIRSTPQHSQVGHLGCLTLRLLFGWGSWPKQTYSWRVQLAPAHLVPLGN